LNIKKEHEVLNSPGESASWEIPAQPWRMEWWSGKVWQFEDLRYAAKMAMFIGNIGFVVSSFQTRPTIPAKNGPIWGLLYIWYLVSTVTSTLRV
jgi:hypothetical protein